jgi:hypothetical protein
VADSSLNFEMANVYQRAINYYVEPVITYLERYQECTIPIYEDTISEEDTIFDDGPISDESKHQAQMICDKVDASLNKLKKLKPLK